MQPRLTRLESAAPIYVRDAIFIENVSWNYRIHPYVGRMQLRALLQPQRNIGSGVLTEKKFFPWLKVAEAKLSVQKLNYNCNKGNGTLTKLLCRLKKSKPIFSKRLSLFLYVVRSLSR